MSKILIINGPNLNLLGEREQSQYGKKDYKFLEEICLNRAKELKIDLGLKQSNVEGEIVELPEDSIKLTKKLTSLLGFEFNLILKLESWLKVGFLSTFPIIKPSIYVGGFSLSLIGSLQPYIRLINKISKK